MSLIFGINLSDRIYVAADTRLTSSETGEIKDDIQKVFALGNNGEGLIAVAGNLQIAKYILWRLVHEKIHEELINAEVFKRDVVGWIKEYINDYYKEGNEFCSVAILFAICNQDKKRTISLRDFQSNIEKFQFLAPDHKVLIKECIRAGITNTENDKVDHLIVCNNKEYLLFSIISDYKKRIFEFTEAKYGQCLAYGPNGFTAKDLPTTTFGQFELEEGAGNITHDETCLIALIKTEEKERGFKSVGGSVVSMMLNSEGISYLTGKAFSIEHKTKKSEYRSGTVVEKDKLFGLNDEGERTLLTPFPFYKEKEGDQSCYL